MNTKLNNTGASRGTRNYAAPSPTRPETRHSLPEIIAAQIQAIYLPFLKTELTDKQNDHILSEVEQIIKKVQQASRDIKA